MSLNITSFLSHIHTELNQLFVTLNINFLKPWGWIDFYSPPHKVEYVVLLMLKLNIVSAYGKMYKKMDYFLTRIIVMGAASCWKKIENSPLSSMQRDKNPNA